MKRVGKLAIIGALLKGVIKSCVRIMQGLTHLIKRRLFGWVLLHTYYKIARVVELQLNKEWGKLRVLGSNWTLLPKQLEYFIPLPSTTQKLMLLLVCLLGKFACIQKHKGYHKGYQPHPSASADNPYRDLDYSGYHKTRI